MKIGALIKKISEHEKSGKLPVPLSSSSEVVERLKKALLAEEEKSDGMDMDMDMDAFMQLVVEATKSIAEESMGVLKEWALAVWVR